MIDSKNSRSMAKAQLHGDLRFHALNESESKSEHDLFLEEYLQSMDEEISGEKLQEKVSSTAETVATGIVATTGRTVATETIATTGKTVGMRSIAEKKMYATGKTIAMTNVTTDETVATEEAGRLTR